RSAAISCSERPLDSRCRISFSRSVSWWGGVRWSSIIGFPMMTYPKPSILLDLVEVFHSFFHSFEWRQAFSFCLRLHTGRKRYPVCGLIEEDVNVRLCDSTTCKCSLSLTRRRNSGQVAWAGLRRCCLRSISCGLSLCDWLCGKCRCPEIHRQRRGSTASRSCYRQCGAAGHFRRSAQPDGTPGI